MNISIIKSGFAVSITLALSVIAHGQDHPYKWLDDYDSTQSIASRFPVPDGYKRIDVKLGSFAEWLRNLPLKEGNPPIYFYNGKKKFLQMGHSAVIDIDVGDRDLQQCADAIIRLRAEYFYAKRMIDSIAFNFTSGDRFRYKDWLDGKTPVVLGNEVSWDQRSERANNRANFWAYLEILFTYAGTYSLSEELDKVENVDSIQIGDIFIQGGFPGHAVIAVDLVEHIETGEKLFLLAQSYTPAQDIHIVNVPLADSWLSIGIAGRLWTLEWVFKEDDLMRFR